jgi:ATP-binding cassette subfamily F protein uup
MEAPNVLVLDEPTNDLDIQTLTILEDYLETYPGIVIAVSHDRYFLDKFADRIFSFENGTIKQYEGNFTDYKEAKSLQWNPDDKSNSGSDKAAAKEIKPASADTWKQKSNKPKFTYLEQKEYETIDGVITGLEAEIASVEAETTKAATDYSRLNELMKKKEELEKSLEEKMDRWVYLNDLAEQIEAARTNN